MEGNNEVCGVRPQILVGAPDVARLESLLRSEFAAYCRDFATWPLYEDQELRAFLISWVATFLPEAASQAFVGEVADTMSGFHGRPDFHHYDWIHALHVDAALFAFTGQRKWLEYPLANVDHDTSGLRPLALESLAMVADRLSFHDPELQRGTEFNLRVRHMFGDWWVVLLAVARGDAEAKRALFQGWLDRYPSDYESDAFFGGRALLRALVDGRWVENPFLDHFLEVHQYLCLRLMEEKPQRSLKTGPIPAVQARLPMWALDPLLGQTLWHRLRSHPLTGPYVRLEGK